MSNIANINVCQPEGAGPGVGSKNEANFSQRTLRMSPNSFFTLSYQQKNALPGRILVMRFFFSMNSFAIPMCPMTKNDNKN